MVTKAIVMVTGLEYGFNDEINTHLFGIDHQKSRVGGDSIYPTVWWRSSVPGIDGEEDVNSVWVPEGGRSHRYGPLDPTVLATLPSSRPTQVNNTVHCNR